MRLSSTRLFISLCSIYFTFNYDVNVNCESDVTKCVRKVTQSFFTPYSPIFYVIDESVDDVVTEAFDNSYIILQMRNSVQPKLTGVQNVVIHSNKVPSLLFVAKLKIRFLNNDVLTAHHNFLILTNSHNNVSYSNIFENFWEFDDVNIVVIVYGADSGHQVYTSNAFDLPNNCGTIAKQVYCQPCDDQAIILPKVRKLNNCTFTFLSRGAVQPIWSILSDIFRLLETQLNLTIVEKVVSRNVSRMDVGFKEFTLSSQRFNITQQSVTIYYDEFYFLTPIPGLVPKMKLLLILFKKEVWIMISLTFIITVVFWWLLNYSQNDRYCKSVFGKAFFEILTVTISGSLPVCPIRSAPRLVLASYLVYCLHISCAYTCRLIDVLTIPQEIKGITTLEELADSSMVILAPSKFIQLYFNDTEKDTLYSKIAPRIKEFSLTELQNVIEQVMNFKNCSAVFIETDRKGINNVIQVKTNLISATTIMGKVQLQFRVDNGFYFMSSLNPFLKNIIESGIFNKITQDRSNEFYKKEREEPSEPIVLSLDHVMPIFVVLVGGLFFSCVVFIIEVIPEIRNKKK